MIRESVFLYIGIDARAELSFCGAGIVPPTCKQEYYDMIREVQHLTADLCRWS